MVYYQGRIWYAIGNTFTAGDIVNGPSGTVPYQNTDSILKVTENPLAVGGDGFAVPDTSGDIRALQYTANMNAALGQGPLYNFTRKQIYALTVPVTRANWIAANASNPPVMTVAARKWGSVGDRCVVPANSDLFYQSMEPAIRSLLVSIRNDDQWGNVQLSNNEIRVLQFNNRALMRFATGIEFDNRLLQAVLPFQTPCGVAFQGIIPLDFNLISTLEEKLPPAWEGLYEGLDHLQLFEGDFGGLQRAFSIIHSEVDDSIQLWELTTDQRRDNGDNRVTWGFETPAFCWGKQFEMKELDTLEIWIDKIAGEIELGVEYREDANPCWTPWNKVQFCQARTTCEDVDHPLCYPEQPYCEGQRFPLVFPKPNPGTCSPSNHRPSNVGFQFQLRFTIKGWCRVRGYILYAVPVQRQPGSDLIC